MCLETNMSIIKWKECEVFTITFYCGNLSHITTTSGLPFDALLEFARNCSYSLWRRFFGVLPRYQSFNTPILIDCCATLFWQMHFHFLHSSLRNLTLTKLTLKMLSLSCCLKCTVSAISSFCLKRLLVPL